MNHEDYLALYDKYLAGKATPEEISRCVEILKYLVEDRARLITLSSEERIELLMAAGRLSRPTREDGIREAKAFRRYTKANVRAEDRALRAQSEHDLGYRLVIAGRPDTTGE